jgi:hypothetical protein
MSEDERAIALRLLEIPFLGSEEARAQLEKAHVRLAPGCEEHCGTLEILVEGATPIPDGTPSPLPVEGRFYDVDDMPVDVMLFHHEGALCSLEFLPHSDRVKRRASADEVELLIMTYHERGPQSPH